MLQGFSSRRGQSVLSRARPAVNRVIRPLSKVKFYPIKSSEQLPHLKEVYFNKRPRSVISTNAVRRNLICER